MNSFDINYIFEYRRKNICHCHCKETITGWKVVFVADYVPTAEYVRIDNADVMNFCNELINSWKAQVVIHFKKES